ncbi:MAG: hypothetical protein ACJAVK_001762, partial [Akkermansiaceae bacterium]
QDSAFLTNLLGNRQYDGLKRTQAFERPCHWRPFQ